MKKKKKFSPSGNRTPVSRVTGGDTYHYTNEDDMNLALQILPCEEYDGAKWISSLLSLVYKFNVKA